MAQSEKELEKQLLEAGNAILSPPPSSSELIPLLDRVEAFLTRVEQSPSESMRTALSPSIKALIATDLLRHSDIDVKVSVASCISEITRITAPDAPYDDDQMKEVFQLIVSSFEKLDDMNSPSYSKRTSILETVAKVRSCVVMLDLECDALILEMFQHFLRTIRDHHPENVFSSMETIMTLVLEESEDISVDLLSSILHYLKIQDKEVLPIARQLAEKVIEKCANKLKPYLLPAIKSKGASVNDYSKVVANVCQMESEAVEPSDGDAASKNLAEESADAPAEKPVEVAMESLDGAPPSEEVGPATAGSPKSVVSNGDLQKERDIEETSVTNNDSKEESHDANNDSKEENHDAHNDSKEENHDAHNDSKEESAHIDSKGENANNDSKAENHDANDGVETAVEPNKTSAESANGDELTKSESKPAKSNKRKGRKPSSTKSTLELPEPSLTDDKETVKNPEHGEQESKDVDSAQSKDAVADDVKPTAKEPAEQEKEPAAGVSSPRTAENEAADVTSPSPSENLDAKHSKKDEQVQEKDDMGQETVPVTDVDSKKESVVEKTTESTNVPETKSQKRTGKKASSAVKKDDGVPHSADTSKKKDDVLPKSDTKSVKQSGKKGESDDKKKKAQAKGKSAKDLVKTPSRDDEKKPLPKSTAKSSKEDSDAEKTPKAGSKRKQSPGRENASETKGYGDELVGSKVEVWWPADKAYYKGVVESFDPVKKKHTVLYVDGDVEILTLAKEKWRLLDDEVLPDQADASDTESPDESAEMPKGKKAKIGADQGSKRGKTGTPPKKGGASSSKTKSTPKSGLSKTETKAKSSEDNKAGKSKDLKAGNKSSEDAPKSAVKSKDLKAGNKSSEDAPKSAVKSKDEPKSAVKSKDDDALPKGSNKSKQETPKGASKSKGKSPKASTKSNSNGTGKGKGKAASSSKEEEAENAEGSPEPTKEPETPKGKSPSGAKSLKGSKKRKRGAKG